MIPQPQWNRVQVTGIKLFTANNTFASRAWWAWALFNYGNMAGELETVFDGVARFRESIKALQTSQVLVGIPQETGPRKDGAPISNAALGYIEEYGQPDLNIPARPTLVPGVKKVQDKIAEEFKFSIKECFKDPHAIEKHNNRAGIIAVSSVKDTIRQSDGLQPLADSTVLARARRGKAGAGKEAARRIATGVAGNDLTRPLIDSGQWLNSHTYVIRKK